MDAQATLRDAEVLIHRNDGAESVVVSVAASGARLVPSADAALAFSLLPAMTAGGDLSIEGEVSAQLLRGSDTAQEILAMWAPGARQIELKTRLAPAHTAGMGRTFSFFSGGVDSFYSAITAPDVDALVFVHGFDIALDQTYLRSAASEAARRGADALGKPLIEVVTDLRVDKNGCPPWGMYHGAAMAGVAHLLSADFDRCIIPSSFSYADLFPWGSHPLLDPLWSSESMLIEHHGAGVTRFQKIGRIVEEPAIYDNLRVCWENRNGDFNCGECEKCTRTMAALRAHGVLDRVSTFSKPLDLRNVRRGHLNSQTQVAFTQENLKMVEQAGGDEDLARALRWRLRLGRQRHQVARLKARVKGAVRRLGARVHRRGS